MAFYHLQLADDAASLKSFDAKSDGEAIAVANALFDRLGGFGFRLWEAQVAEGNSLVRRLVRRKVQSRYHVPSSHRKAHSA